MTEVLVVGGGIAGLTTALSLHADLPGKRFPRILAVSNVWRQRCPDASPCPFVRDIARAPNVVRFLIERCARDTARRHAHQLRRRERVGPERNHGWRRRPTVTVTNATDLAHYAGLNTPYTIQITGRITFDDMVTVVANKTIVGLGSTAEISGGGLQMGSTTRPGNNMIVRNIGFTNASDDSISVTNSAHHVWIDHNDFSSGFDGLLDIKRQSDYVTVSWNHFHDHSKTTLVGHSDTYTQDVGRLKVRGEELGRRVHLDRRAARTAGGPVLTPRVDRCETTRAARGVTGAGRGGSVVGGSPVPGVSVTCRSSNEAAAW